MTSDSPKWFYSFVFVCLCWTFFVWNGLSTAIEIWWQNEIFNHCFFIMPCSIYLVYINRFSLFSEPFEPTLSPLFLLLPTCFVYIVGLAGDINIFLHIATFFSLILVVWCAIGTKAVKKIFFPLVFILFCIPVGEQLTPYLQEIAATGAVFLIELTGVPLYRNGLYIEIPGGRFLVAEACSGVSFFIASCVIGCIYAYLNFSNYKRRFSFIVISLLLPVLANIIRVYGIIMIAYISDMEHAVGADHLVYGWFFFAFIILCLLGIGELLRTSDGVISQNKDVKRDSKYKVIGKVRNLFTVSFVLILFSLWTFLIKTTYSTPVISEVSFNQFISEVDICNIDDPWQPKLMQPTKEIIINFKGISEGCTVRFVNAWYDGLENELVSDLNRVFDPEYWAIVSSFNIIFNNGKEKLQFTGIHITSPSEEQRFIVSWFKINDRIFTNKIYAKLYQTYLALVGKSTTGEIKILASKSLEDINYILQNKSIAK